MTARNVNIDLGSIPDAAPTTTRQQQRRKTIQDLFLSRLIAHFSVSFRTNVAKSIPMAAKIALITAAIVVVVGAGVGVGVYFALAGQSQQSFAFFYSSVAAIVFERDVFPFHKC